MAKVGIISYLRPKIIETMKEYIQELRATIKDLNECPIQTPQMNSISKTLKGVTKELNRIRRQQTAVKQNVLTKLLPLVSHEDWLKVRKLINKI